MKNLWLLRKQPFMQIKYFDPAANGTEHFQASKQATHTHTSLKSAQSRKVQVQLSQLKKHNFLNF